jgi:hypothetical protein
MLLKKVFENDQRCVEFTTKKVITVLTVRQHLDDNTPVHHSDVAGGLDGLKDCSRAPKRPQRTARRVTEALIELRKTHPSWGPRKLLAVLANRQPTWCQISKD